MPFTNVDFAICRNLLGFAENFIIALFSIRFIFFLKNTDIITRNIYAAIFCYVFIRQKFIYETHTIESGLRALIQRILLKSKRVKTVVISKSLKDMLIKKHNLKYYNLDVLHDAARQNLPLKDNKVGHFSDAQKFEIVLGYFGSLHSGRGIDIIEEMAKKLHNSLFVVFGPPGQNPDFEKRVIDIHPNIRFYGFISHKDIHINMMQCDILLMPYQYEVSIGKSGSDTSKWMSPMKMFEYMAANKPIISSKLDVLQEVLINEHNSILVEPDDVSQWVKAVNLLHRDIKLSNNLAANARYDYENEYNWMSRAKKLKAIINDL